MYDILKITEYKTSLDEKNTFS